MTTTELIVEEQDEGGNLTATYVQSSTITKENSSRIDTIVGPQLLVYCPPCPPTDKLGAAPYSEEQ